MIDNAELEEILIAHQKWLDGEPDGIRANLSGADLRNIDLRGENLSHANLGEINLCASNTAGLPGNKGENQREAEKR